MSLGLLRGPTPMLVGMVIVFAMLAVGFGYVAFGTNPGPSILFHGAFLVFTVAFLVAFVRLIRNKVEHHVHSSPNQWDSKSGRER